MSLRLLRLPVLALVASLLSVPAWAALSEAEEHIVAAVKARTPAALELLERSVRINSGTLHTEGVRQVGALYRAELEAMGFASRWIEMPARMQRAGHLAASREGQAGQRLLLLGHLDTVFEKDSAVSLWENRGARVRGQGVNDMKGGNVVLLEALRALHAAGALEGTTIHVLFTGDEERVGTPIREARAELVALAKRSDAALSFEASGRLRGQDTASIARRSAGGWSLKVTARPGHAAGMFSPSQSLGAVYEAARVLNAFREQLPEPGLSISPGVAAGGTQVTWDDTSASGTVYGKTNVIPRDFMVRGDLRYLTPEQGAKARERMREIVAASLPGTRSEISIGEAYPPMPPTEGGRRLLEAYSRASQDAGLGAIAEADPASRGAGDVQFAAPHVPGIDGLGATGSGAHTDDEDLDVASVERSAIRAALFIYRLTRP